MATPAEIAFRKLVDDYRTRCLWYLRSDYYPVTPADQERVLLAIERHGDVAALKRVAALRLWLSQASNATSVSS